MRILPADKSPLQSLLSKINTWNKSDKFIVRHVVTRVVSAVAVPFAALATLSYHLLGEFKWGGYLIGQITWKGQKISQSLPKEFTKKALHAHGYKIMTAVVAIFSFPIAVIAPEVYLKKISNRLNNWINNQISSDKALSLITVDKDIQEAGKGVAAVQDEGRYQRLSQIVASTPANDEELLAKISSNFPDPTAPLSSRVKQTRSTVKGLFAQDDAILDKAAKIDNRVENNVIGLMPPPPPPWPPKEKASTRSKDPQKKEPPTQEKTSNASQASKAAPPQKRLPPTPEKASNASEAQRAALPKKGPPPRSGGPKKTVVAPAKRGLPATPGAAKDPARKQNRLSKTVEHPASPVDMINMLRAGMDNRRRDIAPDETVSPAKLGPAALKALREHAVAENEWDDT